MLKDQTQYRWAISFHNIELFAAFLFFLLIPFKNTGIIHYVIWLGAVATMCNVGLTAYYCRVERKTFLSFLVLLLVLSISLIVSSSINTDGLLYSVLCYIALFWTIALNNTFYKNEKKIESILRFAICSGVLFSVYSFFPFAYYRDDRTISPNLTLFFGNSNLTGIYIFCVVCILLVATRKKRKRFALSVLILYLLYLLWKTGARTCILAALFVVPFSILSKKNYVPKIAVLLCFFLPILFVPMYLILYREGYSDIVILGKDLFSGRQFTYKMYLSYLQNTIQWLFGNLGVAGFQNAHNAPLAHVCSTGLIGTTVFYSMLLRKTMECRLNQNKIACIALICILGLFIQSIGEASIFLGGFPGIVFVYILFYLAGKGELE